MSKLKGSSFRRMFGTKRDRSRFRNLGDAARDSKDWGSATSHYRRHLDDSPHDFAIWVQYGHALKEDGKLGVAITAYNEALALAPDDADLLLNLGHAYKAAGENSIAASFYERSVIGNDNLRGRRELARMGAEPAALLAQAFLGKRELAAIVDALKHQCSNLLPIAASAVTLVSTDQLGLFSDDPWIEFAVEKSDDFGKLGLLTIRAASTDNKKALNGQIYVDPGSGYDERSSVSFVAAEGVARIMIVNPASLLRLRWDPDRAENQITVSELSFRSISDADDLALILAEAGVSCDDQIAKILKQAMAGDQGDTKLPLPIQIGGDVTREITINHDYTLWRLKNETISHDDYQKIGIMTDEMAYKPSFSFIMPTYNTPIDLLTECLDSMLSQTYPYFEVCVADDNSSNPQVVETLSAYAERDPRLKFVARKTNGHISAASNSALDLATGEFVALMDHDDLIPSHALFVVAWYLNQHPSADILFSDEDKITPGGQYVDPYFKGDFNKFLLFGHNMVSHLGIYRRSLVEQVDGFRHGLEGSQDYDLFLRCYEQSADDRIVHIPHVLYHWRQVPGSTAISADQKGYALLAAQQAINGHFERTGMPLRSVFAPQAGNTAVRPSRLFNVRVSIIIPTRNGLDVLAPCIASILDRPQGNIEILIIDNGSDDPETLAYLDHINDSGIVRVLRYPHAFNYSLINNFAAAEATGDILCFLNNDTEVISGHWIDRARAFLSMAEIGAVGARLYYSDGVLQHFGIGIGMSEHRVAGLPHAGFPSGHTGYFSKAALIQEVSAVTAACIFLRAETFRQVGGFEADLRVAYNDVDLCLKIRAQGLKILVDPDISLYHKESRTRGSDRDGENARRLDQEAAWMHKRWGAALLRDPYISPNIDLMRNDFGYDFEPRAPFPWKR